MTPSFDKIHNRFKLNGLHFDRDELKEVAYSYIKEGVFYEKEIGDFLFEWTNDRDVVEVRTSGSTGLPKIIKLKKQAMVASALATGNYFNLEPGNTCLHCLPTHFIAGKMMLIRAMILGLEITTVEPLSKPVFDTDTAFDFVSMVPIQLEKSLKNIDNMKLILVGGAPVSKKLASKLAHAKPAVFETYGMTETITHIAAKRLNGDVKSRNFTTLPGVMVSIDERNCLVIKAPYLSDDPIITNDVVSLVSETEFNWLGRADHIINVGGVKLQPEAIEEKLHSKIDKRFFITSENDSKLGEHVVLVIESEKFEIPASTFDELEKFEIPKNIYFTTKFIEDTPGKIQIQATLDKIKR